MVYLLSLWCYVTQTLHQQRQLPPFLILLHPQPPLATTPSSTVFSTTSTDFPATSTTTSTRSAHTSLPAAEMDSQLDKGGSDSTTGLVGTVAGVGLGGASLASLVVVVVMCILRKNREKSIRSTSSGVSNTIYGEMLMNIKCNKKGG